MIGSLRGEVLERSDTELLVEVQGVGYRVQATPGAIDELVANGPEAFIHIHHHIREDSQVLFGFTSMDERKVFEILIATHGVGPSLALAILSVHSPLGLRTVIAEEDTAAMCMVPGVGKKTAARLMVELKSRLDLPTLSGSTVSSSGSADGTGSSRADVREALAGLGYGSEEIVKILADLPDDLNSEDLLRQALQRLAVS
ncbi:MAG TPA: Holliday junction branch migration protein RuvA [Microthrixaceae bacterium]|nr:Holliday junction branch migration protein RuvA [Microthrixaceae bacterium]